MELSTAFLRRLLLGTVLAAVFSLLLPHAPAAAAPDTVPLDDIPAPLQLDAGARAQAIPLDEEPATPSGRDALVAEVIARHEGEFPMVDNELVRRAMGQLVGTSGARAHVRTVLDRHRDYADLVDRALVAAGLPKQLAAVPVIESGYTNARLAAPSAPQGLWAFMAPTARAFGLRVDAERDERMDPARSTAAAVRYLRSLHGNFGDWALALAGYNQGGGAVQGVVRAQNTDDAWELMRRGALKDYAARVVAVAFVMEEPALAAEPMN
jgi:hypothetical protein